MRSSSSPSADPFPGGEEWPPEMRRRFVEALRRAEIIALVNAADSEEELARVVSEELCEVYDAEVALLLEWGGAEASDRLIGATGLRPDAQPDLSESLRTRVTGAGRALLAEDVAISGTPAARVMLTCRSTGRDRRVGLVVARLYEQGFDPAEIALLEGVTVSVAHALERLWALSELEEVSLSTAAALANAMEARDGDTAGHAQDIAELAIAVGARLGLSAEELADLRLGAIFHDIGKIAVRDEVLRKPGPLSAAERREIERHVLVGEQILAPIPFMRNARLLVRHSHERWDGCGYPDGLRSERIPRGARIICVVDAWDAMTTDRPYRAAIGRRNAVAELQAHAGTQFDPEVVAAFLAILEEAREDGAPPGGGRSGLQPPAGPE